MLRRLISWLLSAGLCLLTTGGPALAAPPTPPLWQSKVDPWVLEETNRGRTEFILFLPAQADLSQAAALPTKLEKGRYVYETLFTPSLSHPSWAAFPVPVTPSVSGVPASATAAFNPNPVAASWSTTLTIGNTAAAAMCTYLLVITGITGLASGSTSAQLHRHSTPPAAVSEVAIDRTSASQVQLMWCDAARATGYQVCRSAVNEPHFAAAFIRNP